MAQIRLTRAGQALVAKGSNSERKVIVFRKEVFKIYTLKRVEEQKNKKAKEKVSVNESEEKVLVNESEIFPEKPKCVRW